MGVECVNLRTQHETCTFICTDTRGVECLNVRIQYGVQCLNVWIQGS